MNSCASSERSVQHTSSNHGFTLVEVMIATVISSVLLVTLTSTINNAINVWTRHDRRIGMVREMRAAVNFLESDLSGFLALPDDPDSFADDSWLRFQVTKPTDNLASSRLLFLTASRQPARYKGQPDLGNVQLVAYAVGLTEDAGGRHSQKLFRKAFSPQETQDRISGLIQSNAPLLSASEWTSMEKGTDGAEPIAYDVVRFTAQPLEAIKGLATESGTINGLGAETTTWPDELRPAAVDFTLRIVSHRTAAQLETAADWRGKGALAGRLLGNPATPEDYSDDSEVSTHQFRVLLP